MKILHISFILFLFISCKQKEKAKIASNENQPNNFEERLSQAAISIIDPSIDYDPAYFSIQYQNGDVPAKK